MPTGHSLSRATETVALRQRVQGDKEGARGADSKEWRRARLSRGVDGLDELDGVHGRSELEEERVAQSDLGAASMKLDWGEVQALVPEVEENDGVDGRL